MLLNIIKRHVKLTGILAAVIIASILPLFIHSPYHLDILITIIIRAVLAMTFIMLLRNGMINLGIAAFWGIGAYTSTMLVMKLHMSFWISLPISALITGAIALIFGYILIGSGSAGFSFVILSSVIGMLFSVVVGNLDFLGGYNGITNIPPPDPIKLPFLPVIEFGIVHKEPFYYLALFLLLVIILICRAFYTSRIGRAWTAVGLSPRLAESIGVNLFRYKLLAFGLASAIAGLIGSFFAHYSGFVIPDTYSMWVNIYIQTYAILGGIGYAILGPLVGSTVMTLIPEFMRIAVLIAPIVTGVILILLILFLPQGLLGLLEWRKSTAERFTRIGRSIKLAFSNKRWN